MAWRAVCRLAVLERHLTGTAATATSRSSCVAATSSSSSSSAIRESSSTSSSTAAKPARRDASNPEYHISRFPYSIPIQTRWNDNDVYGHVNNIIYYSFFDTVVNKFLITRGGLDIVKSPVIGLVVHSECEYFRELSYPEIITAGLRVGRLGERSVEYEVGIFKEHRHHKHHHHHGAQHHHQHHHQRGQSEEQAEEIEMRLAAFGKFVHVFVNRETRAAVAIPESLRPELEKLVVKSA